MEFTNTVTINRSVADVFNFLADFENVPRWNYAISNTTKLTGGPVAVGSRYRQTRTVPTRREEAFEVTEFEPDHRLSIRGNLGPFRAELSYLIQPAGASSATLVNTVWLQASGPLRLVAPLATSRIKPAVAANLDALKRVLELDG